MKVENGENHVQFQLPWAQDKEKMPNNYNQAKASLQSLQKRLNDKPEVRAQYCEKIEAAIQERHIVQIPNDELVIDLKDKSKPQYYIPHFNTSQNKFRVVYDAAREYKGMSLNKLLNRGPIFMQSLRSILLRFGETTHAIAGDISNIFFQIRIAPEDRDMLRILWFSEPEMKGEVVAYKFQVAPYGIRCIPSMAGFAMLFTAEMNIPNIPSDTAARLSRDMFVDDSISGVNSVEEGRNVIKDITCLLRSTGFTITKWNASCHEILSNVPEADLAPSIRNISEKECDMCTDKRQMTLGIVWDTNTDELYINKPHFNNKLENGLTKRQAVSMSHQLFDPLSWWAPFYVRMKLCCSKIVRQVDNWDIQVPLGLKQEWKNAIDDLAHIDSVSLPRRRVPADILKSSKLEYHLFTDSSKDIAAAALYLRVQCGSEYEINLVAAKTSIFSQAEMARESIPRKEIIALDLGARLLRECLDSTTLDIDDYCIWTDSKTVIQWCTEKSLELRVFERNRVDLILRNTKGKLPKYVPSHNNPADVATRPFCTKHSERWELWTRGPLFLRQQNVQSTLDKLCPLMGLPKVGMTIATPVEDKDIGFLQYTLDRTNTLSKVVKVVCNADKCFQTWKSRVQRPRPETNPLTTNMSLHTAKIVLIRVAQTETFGRVLKHMQQGCTFEDAIAVTKEKIPANVHHIKGYIPFLDAEGVLRVGGRMDYAEDIKYEEKHPASLPPDHPISRLFILDRHEKLGHRAAEMVLASLCQDVGVHLIGGVRAIRRHLSSCFQCKVLRQSRAEQLMAPLPAFRVKPRQPVFSSVSIDYAGPYLVKRGRSEEKRWVCLFVCNVTTAVRVEIVESLETTAFLNALRRFLCLTGSKTRHIRSDCSTTFTGAANLMSKEDQLKLQRAEQSTDIHQYLQKYSISWDFSTPGSSHHQGLVERHIRTFKEVSRSILGVNNQTRTPSDFELITVFREAEFIMNCRPLGRRSRGVDDFQALRPLDLMTGFLEPEDDTLTLSSTDPGDRLRRGHKLTQWLVQEWWERWIQRCSSNLQQRQKWRKVKRNLQKGDMVLLLDDATPPIARYPYAIVIDTKMCRDGKVRSVTLRMTDGRVRQRDVRKIALIEATHESKIVNRSDKDIPIDYSSDQETTDNAYVPLITDSYS